MSTGKASAIIASGTMVSRLLGFAKMVLLAIAIGQSSSLAAEAFGMANQLPNNVYALVAGGVMSAVLVPQIVKASKAADGASNVGAANVRRPSHVPNAISSAALTTVQFRPPNSAGMKV